MKDTLPSKDKAQEVDLRKDIDTSGWGGGGSCFSDKSFELMGKTIVIPLSDLCQYLIYLRYAIMLIAGIVSYKMVSGSILRSL
nr:virulence factor TspB C-terminal domain-related protein [Undibacterium sp. FT79W]